jgi:hypothetical protein
MKYKRVEINGHQRAGNHYLAYLINENFLGLENFNELIKHAGHKYGYKHGKFHKDVFYIYIYRNFEDTAKSFFKIRGRFCIGTDNLEDLLGDKKMSEYASKNVSPDIQLDKVTAEIFKKSGDSVKRRSPFAFQYKTLSLKEWHSRHIKSWLKLELDNLICVKYEDLINDFHNTMLKIAKKLGSDKTEFVNIDKRVGLLHKDVDDVWDGTKNV